MPLPHWNVKAYCVVTKTKHVEMWKEQAKKKTTIGKCETTYSNFVNPLTKPPTYKPNPF